MAFEDRQDREKEVAREWGQGNEDGNPIPLPEIEWREFGRQDDYDDDIHADDIHADDLDMAIVFDPTHYCNAFCSRLTSAKR